MEECYYCVYYRDVCTPGDVIWTIISSEIGTL